MKYGGELLCAFIGCAFGCGEKALVDSDGGNAASSSSGGNSSGGPAIEDGSSSGSSSGTAGGVLGSATCGAAALGVAGEGGDGACGHDCLGGACSGGACQPVVLVTVPSPGIGSFAIDATSVYWTSLWTGDDGGALPTNGVVAKCAIAGSTARPTLLAAGQAFPEDILVSGSTLYWLDYNAASLMQCSVDCNGAPTTFQNWWPNIWQGGFAASATEVFFSGPQEDGLVEQCPVSGCSAPTTFASRQQTPTAMVIGGADLYWLDEGTMLTNPNGADVSDVNGGLMTCPVDGCDGGPAAIVTGLSNPDGLVVSGTTAYFAQGNSVLACSVTGCNGTPTTILSLPAGSGGVQGFAVDATDVYVADAVQAGVVFSYDWEIRRCSLSGCPNGSTLLSSTPYVSGGSFGGSGPVPGLVVDGTRIYFVSGDATQVLALAK